MADSYNNGVPPINGRGTGNHFHIPDATAENANSLHNIIASRLNAAARKSLDPKVAQDAFGNFVVRVNNPGFNNTEEARTFDITRDNNGLILGGNSTNPAYRQAVTGIASLSNNTVRNSINTLVDVLHQASSGNQKSIGSVMQGMSMPTLNVDSLTPQMSAKWSTAYLAANNNNPSGNANRSDILGAKIPGFQVQWGGKFGDSGAAHIWDSQSLNSKLFPQNERGESELVKAKREKNKVVGFGTLESIPGIPASIQHMAMGLPGQTQQDNVYARRVGFQMFGGDSLGEGTQLVNSNMGHLATYNNTSLTLTAQQTNQFKSGQFGFQEGDIFRHKNVNIPGATGVQQGIFGVVPGLGVSSGSNDFTRIHSVQFDEATSKLNVTYAQYTNAAVAASKFEKKAQMQPAAAAGGAFGVRNSSGQLYGFSGVQAMPSPQEASSIGLNSLRTQFSEDRLKSMFMDYTQSTFRMGSGQQLIKSGEEGFDQAFPINQEVANHMWGSGILKGYTSSIMSSMGAAHFNASMKIGFTDQTITQQQYDTQNRGFEFGGQSYQRFSNATPVEGGFLNVQAANVYADLTIGERYQSSYDTGRTSFSGAILDNMAYSHPANYDTLAQRQAREGNSALRFRQVMMANNDPHALSQLQRQRKIVDIGDMGAGEIMAGIPQDHPDRQGEFMRQLAASQFGRSVVRMNGNLMPSPQEALQRVTQDSTGKVVGNFGASYFNAFTAHSAIAEAALIGEDTGPSNAAYGIAAGRAYSQAQTLANSSSVIDKSQAIEQRNTLGGPAGSMPGLQPNEILMGRESFYHMMGVNDLPEDMRSSAIENINQMRETMPDYFSIEHTMHPITTPHQALYNLKPVLEDEYRARFGQDSLPDMSSGKYFISQTLATAHGKDFDGDTSKARAAGGYYRKGRGFGTYRSNVKPTSNEEISGIAARQYEEQATLRESLDYDPAQYQKDAAAYARDGLYKSTEQILNGPKGFSGQVESQASIGPTYNTGIGKMVGFARLAGNRMKAEAAGWIAQVGYQTATKEKAFNDPGFNRISQMLRSGNYDWSKQYGPDQHVAGYISTNTEGVSEYVNFKQNVATHEQHLRGQGDKLGSRNYGGSVRGNLAHHIAEGFAMLDSSTENDQEYATKVAPNVARMMLPDRMDNDSESHNIMTQALIKSRGEGDWSHAMSTFSGLVGGQSGVIESVLGQGDRASSSMAMVTGAMQARMYSKNEPAAMSRQGNNSRTRANQYNEASALLDVKDTDEGGAAHIASVDKITNREVGRHTISVDEQMRGARSSRIDPAQELVASPQSAGIISRQSRNEYFAGIGGLYTKNNKASIQGFFGEGLGIDDLSANQLFGYDAMNVMERTVLGMKHMNPDLKDMPVSMGSGKRFEPSYNPNNHEIRLPNPDEFQAIVADKMGDDQFMNRMSGIIGIDKDQLTPELVMAGIIGHEFGHARDNADLSASGGLKSAREQDRMERHRAMNGLMRYEDVTSERTADSIANQQLNSLGEAGADLGLYRDSKRVRQSGRVIQEGSSFTNISDRAAMGISGKGRKVLGAKSAYVPDKGVALPHEKAALRAATQNSMAEAKSSQSSKPIPPPMDEEAHIAAMLADEGVQGEPPPNVPRSGDNGLRNPEGGYTSNTSFNIAHQSNQYTSFKTKLTDTADVEQLTSFVNEGGLGRLQSYMDEIGSVGMDAFSQDRTQLRGFRATVAHYNKAANAVQSYSAEAAQVAADPDHVKRLSNAALGVEGILARDEGHVGMAMGDINRSGEVHEMSAQAKSAWEGGLPDKYAVSGKIVAKGMAGASNIEDLGGALGELAKSVKNVNTVTQEQYKSMKSLTQSYDAAEHVVSKLTEKQQRGIDLSQGEQSSLDKAKDVLSKNGSDLDTIRSQFAKASMGGIDIQGPVMGQEERQQRLMEALNRGGIGGARARSKARDQGLYGSGGDEGDEGGLDYLGHNFQSEDSINAIGGLMRLGNRASSVLHGMTHLTHNIINPIAQEIQQYGNVTLGRQQMLNQIGAQGYNEFIGGQGGQILARQGGLNLAHEVASQQVYNTYAGAASFLGNKTSGLLQGMAQSIGAPALSTAVGLQAIGAGAYAGPAALAVGAVAAGAWINGATSDRSTMQDAVMGTRAGNGKGLSAGFAAVPSAMMMIAGGVLHNDVFQQGITDANIADVYNGRTGLGGVGTAMSTRETAEWAAKNRGTTVGNAARVGLKLYREGAGTKLGLSEDTMQGNFMFDYTYGQSMSGNNMRDSLDQMSAMGVQGASQQSILGVQAEGRSATDVNAVAMNFSRYMGAFKASQAAGESPLLFGQRQAQQTQNAGIINQARFNAYGMDAKNYDQYTVDQYANDPYRQQLRNVGEQSAYGRVSTNNYAVGKTGRNGQTYNEMANSRNDYLVAMGDTVGMNREIGQEQYGLGVDLNMRVSRGQSLSADTLMQTRTMNQTQFTRLQGILSGDQTITSQTYGIHSAKSTIDVQTGLGINDYSMDSQRLAQYKQADKLGLLNGVTASDLVNGTQGLQRKQELAQRDMQMFQYTQQSQQLAVQSGMMMGGATLNAQGFAQGGNMSNVASVFSQNGMKFNAGNGMTQWQVEDAQTQLSRQNQVFQMNQGTQQMQMQVAQFNTSGQQYNENRALQVAQFNYNTQYQGQQMQIDRSHQVAQQGWQQEDLTYNKNMSQLQFGFQMRDADRNIRYARGRDRLDLIRQKDDATILHAAEMGQEDKQQQRLTTQEKWSDDQFKRDEDNFKKTTEFQKESMDLDKKHFDQNRAFEMQSIQMSQAAHTQQMQMMTAGFKLEDQGRLLQRQQTQLQINMQSQSMVKQQELQVMMNRTNDILQGVGTSQHNIMAQWQADLQTTKGYADALTASLSGQGSVAPNVPSGTGSNNPNGGGLSIGGYMMTRAERTFMSQVAQYDIGGYTGAGDRLAPRGVVHGGEYVIPQQGTPVVRGDNQATLAVLNNIAAILERIEKNPAVVNAVINTNQHNVAMKNLNLTDLAHGNIH